MSLISPGRVYGIICALALLACFMVPLQIEVTGTACSLWSLSPDGCEVGVKAVLRGACLYCLFAGYLTSRAIDREPVYARATAALVFVVSTVLLALPLWLALHAAFW